MKIVTLNIRHGGGNRVNKIISRLLKQNADTIVLTEFRENKNSSEIKESLRNNGYFWQASCMRESKINSILVASRIEFEVIPLLGLPESCNNRTLMAKFPEFFLLAVYFAQKEEKQKLFNYISMHCISLISPKGVIIGDFNTGKPFLDEKAKTFSCIEAFINLEKLGLIDSWRSRNSDSKEFSWYSSAGNGFRIDHVFSTLALDQEVKCIGYDHTPRIEGETDHSAMYVEFEN
jgi:exodeoxyribonuclease III